MKVLPTPYGTCHILTPEALKLELLHRIKSTAQRLKDREAVIALTGGSTPKAFYQWAAQHTDNHLREALANVVWTVSDERCVPFEDDQSNWGHAWRGWLDTLKVPHGKRLPWPTKLTPMDAASRYNHAWITSYGGPHRAYDLCLLGMGDDAHTASLWPGCELIGSGHMENFAATQWPGRGWRLTLTPSGLSRCDQVVVIVTGMNKAEAMRDVIKGPFSPKERPAQLLKAHADRTVWLLDEAAATLLH
jgi:6-phosphogluconolactonase